MPVIQNYHLLRTHGCLHLKLSHAAIGNFPIHNGPLSYPVNRLLMIFEDGGRDDNRIRDVASGEVFTLHGGQLYFIPCHHAADATLTDALYFVSFQFNMDLFHGLDVFRDYGRCMTMDRPDLVDEARGFIRRDADLETLCRVNRILYSVCVSLLADHPAGTRPIALLGDEYDRLLAFVRESGDATTTVAVLADRMGMRRDVFSRKFTRDMGITPKEFIGQSLARKAMELLLTPDYTVARVADELRFSSENYFYRFFKRNAGLTPKAYCRLHGLV